MYNSSFHDTKSLEKISVAGMNVKESKTVQNLIDKNIPSEKILEILFELVEKLLANGSNDYENSNIIVTPDHLLYILNFIKIAEEAIQVSAFNRFIDLCSHYRNRDIFCKSNLIKLILDLSSDLPFLALRSACELCVLLFRHHAHPSDVNALIGTLKKLQKIEFRYKVHYLFHKIPEMFKKDPTGAFNFIGTKNEGIFVTPFNSNPKLGYTISMWINIENKPSISDISDTEHRLFTMLNENKEGIIISLIASHRNRVIATVSTCINNRVSTQIFEDVDFLSKRWYHIAITHSPKRNFFSRRSEISLWVDGKLTQIEPAPYIDNHKPFDKIFWGADDSVSYFILNPTPAIRGQTTMMCMFNEVLSEEKINVLYQSNIENPHFLADHFRSSLIFLYHPQATCKDLVIDISGNFHGIMFGSLRAIRCMNLKDALSCAGGIELFYPMLLNVNDIESRKESGDEDSGVRCSDNHYSKESKGDSKLESISSEGVNISFSSKAADSKQRNIKKKSRSKVNVGPGSNHEMSLLGSLIIKSIACFIKDNEAAQEQVKSTRAISTLSLILERLSFNHIHISTLVALDNFLSVITNSELYKFFHSNIIWNPRIWNQRSYEVQLEYQKLLKRYVFNSSDEEYFRKIIGFERLVDDFLIYSSGTQYSFFSNVQRDNQEKSISLKPFDKNSNNSEIPENTFTSDSPLIDSLRVNDSVDKHFESDNKASLACNLDHPFIEEFLTLQYGKLEIMKAVVNDYLCVGEMEYLLDNIVCTVDPRNNLYLGQVLLSLLKGSKRSANYNSIDKIDNLFIYKLLSKQDEEVRVLGMQIILLTIPNNSKKRDSLFRQEIVPALNVSLIKYPSNTLTFKALLALLFKSYQIMQETEYTFNLTKLYPKLYYITNIVNPQNYNDIDKFNKNLGKNNETKNYTNNSFRAANTNDENSHNLGEWEIFENIDTKTKFQNPSVLSTLFLLLMKNSSLKAHNNWKAIYKVLSIFFEFIHVKNDNSFLSGADENQNWIVFMSQPDWIGSLLYVFAQSNNIRDNEKNHSDKELEKIYRKEICRTILNILDQLVFQSFLSKRAGWRIIHVIEFGCYNFENNMPHLCKSISADPSSYTFKFNACKFLKKFFIRLICRINNFISDIFQKKVPVQDYILWSNLPPLAFLVEEYIFFHPEGFKLVIKDMPYISDEDKLISVIRHNNQQLRKGLHRSKKYYLAEFELQEQNLLPNIIPNSSPNWSPKLVGKWKDLELFWRFSKLIDMITFPKNLPDVQRKNKNFANAHFITDIMLKYDQMKYFGREKPKLLLTILRVILTGMFEAEIMLNTNELDIREKMLDSIKIKDYNDNIDDNNNNNNNNKNDCEITDQDSGEFDLYKENESNRLDIGTMVYKSQSEQNLASENFLNRKIFTPFSSLMNKHSIQIEKKRRQEFFIRLFYLVKKLFHLLKRSSNDSSTFTNPLELGYSTISSVVQSSSGSFDEYNLDLIFFLTGKLIKFFQNCKIRNDSVHLKLLSTYKEILLNFLDSNIIKLAFNQNVSISTYLANWRIIFYSDEVGIKDYFAFIESIVSTKPVWVKIQESTRKIEGLFISSIKPTLSRIEGLLNDMTIKNYRENEYQDGLKIEKNIDKIFSLKKQQFLKKHQYLYKKILFNHEQDCNVLAHLWRKLNESATVWHDSLFSASFTKVGTPFYKLDKSLQSNFLRKKIKKNAKGTQHEQASRSYTGRLSEDKLNNISDLEKARENENNNNNNSEKYNVENPSSNNNNNNNDKDKEPGITKDLDKNTPQLIYSQRSELLELKEKDNPHVNKGETSAEFQIKSNNSSYDNEANKKNSETRNNPESLTDPQNRPVLLTNTSQDSFSSLNSSKKKSDNIILNFQDLEIPPHLQYKFKINFKDLKCEFLTPCELIKPEITISGYLFIGGDAILFTYDRDSSFLTETDAGTIKLNSNINEDLTSSPHATSESDIGESNHYNSLREMFKEKFRDRFWAIKDIRILISRRYLLEWKALELFMESGKSYLFNFPPGINRNVYNIIKRKHPSLQENFFGTGEKHFKKRQDVTEKWIKREISNFDYLMFLNHISSRSLNDLTQYPVFPWVLSNYESQTLDFNNPKNFRDLRLPVGALEGSRLSKFIERYENFYDENIPRFHYGSHYSSAGAVLHYLIRLEPFTSLFLCLQGGKFDYPDRLFSSISDTWENCLLSTTDVKELIPEFFYLPEMLLNVNKLDLGEKTSTNRKIDDVELPPWAGGSAENFIKIHRQALESEYVSRNLHHWIDLIWGYKQRGPHAENSYNTFFHLTYEGAVNTNMEENPERRKAIISQIENFGQTPAQILNYPHPERNPPKTAMINVFVNYDDMNGKNDESSNDAHMKKDHEYLNIHNQEESATKYKQQKEKSKVHTKEHEIYTENLINLNTVIDKNPIDSSSNKSITTETVNIYKGEYHRDTDQGSYDNVFNSSPMINDYIRDKFTKETSEESNSDQQHEKIDYVDNSSDSSFIDLSANDSEKSKYSGVDISSYDKNYITGFNNEENTVFDSRDPDFNTDHLKEGYSSTPNNTHSDLTSDFCILDTYKENFIDFSEYILIQRFQTPFTFSAYFIGIYRDKVITINSFGEFLCHRIIKNNIYENTNLNNPVTTDHNPDIFPSINALPFSIEINSSFSTKCSPTSIDWEKKYSISDRLQWIYNYKTNRNNAIPAPIQSLFPVNNAHSFSNPFLIFNIDEYVSIILSTSTWDGTLELYQINSWSTCVLLNRIPAHRDRITCFDYDEHYLVTGSEDFTAILWKIEQTKRSIIVQTPPLYMLLGHNCKLTSVSISYEWKLIVVSCSDGLVVVYNLDPYQQKIRNLLRHSSSVSLVKVTLYGSILVFCDEITTLYVYNINGTLLKTRTFAYTITQILTPKQNPDIILLSSGDKIIALRLFDLKQYWNYDIHAKIVHMAFSPCRRYLFISSYDGGLYILANKLGKPLSSTAFNFISKSEYLIQKCKSYE